MEKLPDYKDILSDLATKYDGWFNAHSHLDRAGTLDVNYWNYVGINPMQVATYPLKAKQNLVGDLHKGPAYTKEDLEQRMAAILELMIKCNTRRVDTLIDASSDIGTVAIDAALKIKKEFMPRIDVRIGTQPIFGFKDCKRHPERWEGAVAEGDQKFF